jgi:hypothetical protein
LPSAELAGHAVWVTGADMDGLPLPSLLRILAVDKSYIASRLSVHVFMSDSHSMSRASAVYDVQHKTQSAHNQCN